MLRFNALRVLASDAEPAAREALIAKYAWSNWRPRLRRAGADVLGEAADRIDDDDRRRRRCERIWLASRADTIYAGANEIQLNLIAERALGMPR
jgi:alkylation response protein AidB-like acyl-CoA dehydrogenase